MHLLTHMHLQLRRQALAAEEFAECVLVVVSTGRAAAGTRIDGAGSSRKNGARGLEQSVVVGGWYRGGVVVVVVLTVVLPGRNYFGLKGRHFQTATPCQP